MEEIQAKSYAAALDAVVSQIEKRTPDLSVRHLLIVPDIYTFALEKRLFLSSQGTFDVEITTFNRLYSRTTSGGKEALSKQGAIMLLKKLCRKNAARLTCYSRSALKSGFAVKLYDALNKLRSCAISPDDLASVGGLHKADDISLLYREYSDATRGKYVDAAGRTELLLEAVKEGALSDCHVYVAQYDVISPQIERLLKAIDGNALSLKVYTVLPPEDCKVGAKTEVLGCPENAAEYKEIAKRIRAYAKAGGRYGDVCIADERGTFDTAKRIFDEYAIPYYIAEKLKLGNTELARFIFTALNAERKKYRAADMIALSRNYYSGIEKADADAFCTYVNMRCITYLGFTEKFDRTDSEQSELTEVAERVRQRLMALVGYLSGALKGAENLKNALVALLGYVNAAEKTREIGAVYERAAGRFYMEKRPLDGRSYDGIYSKTLELIELMCKICDGEELGAEVLVDTLREGFEGTEISLVPNLSDSVQIGPVAQFRGMRVKFAVVAGFDDGVLPVCTFDDGLLTDADADKLDAFKLRYEPKSAKTNELCRGELWHFLQAAQRLFVTYTADDEHKPSYDLKLLLGRNGIEERTYEIYSEEMNEMTDPRRIARRLGCESGALEYLLTHVDYKHAVSVAAALGEKAAKRLNYEQALPALTERNLFLRDKTTSVSALQTYFQCPYMYFMQYGLRLKKAEDGEVTPIDVGLLLHKIVEIFVSENMPEDVSGFVKDTLEKIIADYEKYSYGANEKIFAEVKREAVELCKIVSDQIKAGEFTPFATEESFGKTDSKLKTVTLKSGISLNGEIDRVDTYGPYARVIDYKTGQAKFSYSDLYFGKKIQLMIYMRILQENGYRPAGFFYFPFSTNWRDDEYSHRLMGAFNRNPDVLAALDRTLSEPNKSEVIEANIRSYKDGEPVFFSGKNACTESELSALGKYAELVANKATEEILSGNIKPSPANSGERRACSFCDFKSVCAYEGEGRTCDGATADDIYKAVDEL